MASVGKCGDADVLSVGGTTAVGAAVGFLISINVVPMLFLPPGRRDNSNRGSNRHGESLRSEVTGRTEVAPYLIFFRR